MGAVKRDVHRNEHQFKNISLSDENCIKGLIKYRSMLDKNYQYDSEHLKNIQKISLIFASKEIDGKNKENKKRFNELKSKGLISKNKKFKPTKLMVNNEGNSRWSEMISASTIVEFNQELINTYIDLDKLIDNTSLSEKQKIILELLMCGLNEHDIAMYFGQDRHRIKEILDTACKKLKKDYDRQWKYSMAEQDYIKVEWDYKECERCKRSLPATLDYYYKKIDNKDNLHNTCKKCMKS